MITHETEEQRLRDAIFEVARLTGSGKTGIRLSVALDALLAYVKAQALDVPLIALRRVVHAMEQYGPADQRWVDALAIGNSVLANAESELARLRE